MNNAKMVCFILGLSLLTWFLSPEMAKADERVGRAQFAGRSAVKTLIGQWKTEWGTLVLNRNRSTFMISGTYDYNQGSISGQLSDDGTILQGTWSNGPTFKGPDDAGSFTFKLTPDGDAFTGTWAYEDGREGGNWNGTRIQTNALPGASVEQPSPQNEEESFAGEWNTDVWHVLKIGIDGDKATGTFKEGLGKIEGMVSGDGKVLTGNCEESGKSTGTFVFNLLITKEADYKGIHILGKLKSNETYGLAIDKGDLFATKIQTEDQPGVPTKLPVFTAEDENFNGEWDTDIWKILKLEVKDGQASGTFDNGHGTIVKTLFYQEGKYLEVGWHNDKIKNGGHFTFLLKTTKGENYTGIAIQGTYSIGAPWGNKPFHAIKIK